MNKLFLSLVFLFWMSQVHAVSVDDVINFKYVNKKESQTVSVKGYLKRSNYGYAFIHELYLNKEQADIGRAGGRHILLSGQNDNGDYFDLSKCQGKDVIVFATLSLYNGNSKPVLYKLSSIRVFDIDSNKFEICKYEYK